MNVCAYMCVNLCMLLETESRVSRILSMWYSVTKIGP